MSSAAVSCRPALSLPPKSSFNPYSRCSNLAVVHWRRSKRISFSVKAVASMVMEDGFVVVEDDIHALLQVVRAGSFIYLR